MGITKESAEIIERNVETLEELKTKKDVDLNRYLIQVCYFFNIDIHFQGTPHPSALTRIKNQKKIHKCFQNNSHLYSVILTIFWQQSSNR